jgi:hypothetical protein
MAAKGNPQYCRYVSGSFVILPRQRNRSIAAFTRYFPDDMSFQGKHSAVAAPLAAALGVSIHVTSWLREPARSESCYAGFRVVE